MGRKRSICSLYRPSAAGSHPRTNRYTRAKDGGWRHPIQDPFTPRYFRPTDASYPGQNKMKWRASHSDSSAKKRTMTLASKITVLRIIAIPFFVIALFEHAILWAQVIFCLSVFSDALDGAIARLRRERTPLGAFLDPVADKLLLVVTYIVFSNLGWIPLWV